MNIYIYIHIMKKLHILTHYHGNKCFEDYCECLRSVLCQDFIINKIVYSDEKEITTHVKEKDVFIFMEYIPPQFLNAILDGTYKYVYLINTEQSTRAIWILKMRCYLKTNINLVDYDQYQTNVIQTVTDNHVLYLPYQIVPEEVEYLSHLLKKKKKIYDVAFCSTNGSPRRLKIFEQLEKRGISLTNVVGWGKSRDKKIAKAKILVNIHYAEDYRIFEHMRCDRWILSGLLVVSEDSASDMLNDCKDLFIIEKYDNIVNKILEILSNYDKYQTKYINKLTENKPFIIRNRLAQCDKLTEKIMSNKLNF